MVRIEVQIELGPTDKRQTSNTKSSGSAAGASKERTRSSEVGCADFAPFTAGAGFRVVAERAVGRGGFIDDAVLAAGCGLACPTGRVAIDVAERGIAAAFIAREPIEVAGRATVDAAGARG